MDFVTLAQVVLGGLASGSTYALTALGLVLILNTTSVPNFAQGEVGLFATYVAWSVVAVFAVSSTMIAWLGLAVAILTAALIGVAIGTLLLWRAENRSLIATTVITVGLFFAVHGTVVQTWGPSTRQFPSVFGEGVARLGGISVSIHNIGTITTALIASAGLAAWIRFSRIGVISRATVQNPMGATVIGLPTTRIKILMWAIGSALAGLAGALIAPSAYLTPDTMFNVLVFGFAAATLGGLGNLLGAFVGGLILGVLQGLVGVYVSGSAADSVGFVVIVLVLIVRPAGLIGKLYVEKV